MGLNVKERASREPEGTKRGFSKSADGVRRLSEL
jgi:hypothetical protein